MNRGVFRSGKTGERVDAVHQSRLRMVLRHPMPIRLGRVVANPSERTSGCPRAEPCCNGEPVTFSNTLSVIRWEGFHEAESAPAAHDSAGRATP